MSYGNLADSATAGLSSLAAFSHSQNFWFVVLFVWRYLRLIVHMISFWLYKPIPTPVHPTILRSDCTVIIPIADPDPTDPKFQECLRTILANEPAAVIVTTVGRANLEVCKQICAPFNALNENKIRVIQQSRGNKRIQVCHAMPYVKTSIVIGVDATVFWPSTDFLPAILAPFEDRNVGVVGSYKRVVREPTGLNFRSFWNFIGCLYLERHNFEVAATGNVDGGMFVISGRTAAYRAEIFADPHFQAGFTNERFFFGLFGPLNPDDDNFITRWVIRQGWKVKFQYSEAAMIQTRVGTYPRYLSQCLRWVRTTWRSNSASLFTDPFRTGIRDWVYIQQPWCVYAVYLTSFTNFALFTDAALLYLASTTSFADTYGASFALKCMALWILASKLVKPWPHLVRNPMDVLFLPGYFLFGYYHSLLKLYALFTFWNCAWGGRKITDADEVDDDADGDTDDDDYKPESDDDSTTITSESSSRGSGGGDFDLHVSGWNDGFNFHNGRAPYLNRRQRITASPRTTATATPWGVVKTSGTAGPHSVPANVLQPQIPRFSGGCTRLHRVQGVEVEETGTSFPVPKQRTPHVYYDWTRGVDCERLHSEGDNLIKGTGACAFE